MTSQHPAGVAISVITVIDVQGHEQESLNTIVGSFNQRSTLLVNESSLHVQRRPAAADVQQGLCCGVDGRLTGEVQDARCWRPHGWTFCRCMLGRSCGADPCPRRCAQCVCTRQQRRDARPLQGCSCALADARSCSCSSSVSFVDRCGFVGNAPSRCERSLEPSDLRSCLCCCLLQLGLGVHPRASRPSTRLRPMPRARR